MFSGKIFQRSGAAVQKAREPYDFRRKKIGFSNKYLLEDLGFLVGT